MIIETSTTILIHEKEIPLEVNVNGWNESWDKDLTAEHIKKIIIEGQYNKRSGIANNLTKFLVEVKFKNDGTITEICIPCVGQTMYIS